LTRAAGRTEREIQDIALADGRRLRVDGTVNLRDVGGYPAYAGGSVAWRTLFRSGSLHRLDSRGAAGLAVLDLRTIVDLRADIEVRALCAPGALPALVHCAAGQDRTGVVIALVLAVLGVPDELIGADYSLSSVYLDPDSTAVTGRLKATGPDGNVTAGLPSSPAGLILNVLARARAAGGESVYGYLSAHGTGAPGLTALRSALVR
jgi:protein-tyrosine phosphatase